MILFFSSKVLSQQEKITRLDSLITFYPLSKEHKAIYLGDYGKWLYHKKEYNKAIAMAQKDLAYTQNHFSKDSCLILEKYYLLSYYLYKTQREREVISLLQNAELNLNSHCKYYVKCLTTLAKCYQNLGNYYKTMTYYQYALNVLEPTAKSKEKIKYAINISQAYNELGGKSNIEKGRHYLLFADSLSQKTAFNYTTAYLINTALGRSYNFKETLDTKKGTFYFNKSLQLAIKAQDSAKIFSVLNRK